MLHTRIWIIVYFFYSVFTKLGSVVLFILSSLLMVWRSWVEGTWHLPSPEDQTACTSSQNIDCADCGVLMLAGSTPMWLASELVSRHKFTVWSGQPGGNTNALMLVEPVYVYEPTTTNYNPTKNSVESRPTHHSCIIWTSFSKYILYICIVICRREKYYSNIYSTLCRDYHIHAVREK